MDQASRSKEIAAMIAAMTVAVPITEKPEEATKPDRDMEELSRQKLRCFPAERMQPSCRRG